jgi:type VI secretion system protein ImpH
MATPRRQPDAPLGRALFEQAPRFDFFQAVRLLGRLRPDRAPVGRDGSPSDEVVRFTTRPGLAFVPSPVQSLEPPTASDRPAEMTIAALSLTGPAGALPYCYTELLLERARDRDHTLAAFLDLFHHRLSSLFYRAWEKYRPALALERAWDVQRVSRNGAPGESNAFSAHLFALIGLGMGSLRGRHDFPDEALLYYVGLFAQRHRSAAALESLLREYFALPVEVVQFVEHRVTLGPPDCTILGTPGRNNVLGVDLMLGDQVEQVSGKFRLRIGPLSLDRFRALWPGGRDFRRLVQMTRLFVGPGLIFDVQLVLRAEDVPRFRLVSSPDAGPTLGRDAWVTSLDMAEDVTDAVFAPGE